MKPSNYLFSLCVLLNGATQLRAQNLVPNASFEEYTECPDYVGQVPRCTGWEVNAWTPEYFNSCDTFTLAGVTGWVGVPISAVGYQMARTGNGFTGMISFIDSTWGINFESRNEYIGRYLISPLIAGAEVYLSMWVSPEYGYSIGSRPRYVHAGIGMRFSMGPRDVNAPVPNDNQAALYATEVITDSAGWTLIRGAYTPDSAYTYLIIGNFFDQQHSTPVFVGLADGQNLGYTYVDDVTISYDSTAYLWSGIEEEPQPLSISAFPNPFGATCSISFRGYTAADTRITLSDFAGRVIKSFLIRAGVDQFILSGTNLPTGSYLLTLTLPTGIRRSVVLVHVSL